MKNGVFTGVQGRVQRGRGSGERSSSGGSVDNGTWKLRDGMQLPSMNSHIISWMKLLILQHFRSFWDFS